VTLTEVAADVPDHHAPGATATATAVWYRAVKLVWKVPVLVAVTVLVMGSPRAGLRVTVSRAPGSGRPVTLDTTTPRTVVVAPARTVCTVGNEMRLAV
jgi:hypothetical protein